jgi:hypothetical protein
MKPVHERFSWLHESLRFAHEAQFIATAVDVSKGIAVALELVHNSNLARSNNDECDAGHECPPILNTIDTEALAMFAGAAARMLARIGEDKIDYLNQKALREAGNG